MNLVLFSGGSPKDNRAFLQQIESAFRKKKKLRLSFIPADSEDFEDYLPDVEEKLKISAEVFLLDGKPLTPSEKRRLFSSDAIYLGGGNTFRFLQNIRKQKLLKPLREFVKRGGILLGYSAGSILMTPNITTAVVPTLDADENEVKLKDWHALDLVPFEFSPHYVRNRKSDRELEEYSTKVSHPIYACRDGSGIWVNRGQIRFMGAVQVFYQGQKFSIN